jgi:LuxR family quorum-sensing system transcriptional regulator CciR
LRIITAETVGELGVDHFAILHHIDLEIPAESFVRIGNYPDAWKAMIAERRYFADDPILTACEQTVAGFRWSALPNLIEMSARRMEIFEAGAREGLADGYTMPVRVPGEFEGSCSFATRPGVEFPDESIPALHYLGSFAFESARRIVRTSVKIRKRSEAAALSDRQLDCIVLMAQGKSATVTGQLLGISPLTVQQHLKEARRRYNVATTQQLIVRALFDSRITFADIITP